MSPEERRKLVEADAAEFVDKITELNRLDEFVITSAEATAILRDREKRAVANVQAQLTARSKSIKNAL